MQKKLIRTLGVLDPILVPQNPRNPRFYCKLAHKKFPNCISPSKGKLWHTKFYYNQTGGIFAKFITYVYRRANSKSLYSNCYYNSSDAFLKWAFVFFHPMKISNNKLRICSRRCVRRNSVDIYRGSRSWCTYKFYNVLEKIPEYRYPL